MNLYIKTSEHLRAPLMKALATRLGYAIYTPCSEARYIAVRTDRQHIGNGDGLMDYKVLDFTEKV